MSVYTCTYSRSFSPQSAWHHNNLSDLDILTIQLTLIYSLPCKTGIVILVIGKLRVKAKPTDPKQQRQSSLQLL